MDTTKKLAVILMTLCMIFGCMSVSAENFEWEDEISYGETKVITIPQPEGEVDEGYVYFTQFFIFTPEVEGTYRFLVDYEEDESAPYDIFMDVCAFQYVDGEMNFGNDDGYWELENGCEFDAKVGNSYQLMFQYNTNDGRYPEFTFYLESDDVTEIPKTGDESLFLPVCMIMLALPILFVSKKKFA